MAQLADVMRKAVNPETGIIKHLLEIQLQPTEPNLWIYAAEFADPVCLKTYASERPRRAIMKQGGGAGLDRETALWSVLGECLERYAIVLPDEERFVRASARELGDRAMNLEEVIRFSEEQYSKPGFRFPRLDLDAPFDWVEGLNLTSGAPAWVPASMVFMHYQAKSAAEALDKTYSTGVAAGASFESALLSALREVVERDAFACHWLTGATPRRLDVAAIRPALPEPVAALLDLGHLEYNLRDLTTEFEIPCVLSQLRLGDSHGVSSGSSCHPRFGSAFAKALVESFHTFNWVLDMRRWGRDVKDATEIGEFADHVAYYLRADRFAKLRTFYADAPMSTARASASDFDAALDAKAALDGMVRNLAKFGYSVYAVDATPPDIAELDLRVVRALVPGLQPLYAGHEMYHLDPRRLEKFAAYAGIPRPLQLNLEPHPFP